MDGCFGRSVEGSIDSGSVYVTTMMLTPTPPPTHPNQQEEQQEPTVLTSQITGQIDWRRDGIRYRKNEVYIDVLESVNILMSATGAVLRSDVTGQIVMKALLSGWPECKFGLNDKLIMDREAASKAAAGAGGGGHHTRRNAGVEIDDCTFHRCVRLGKFDADRTITFIPPDGEFELMRYRVTENVNLPFRLIPVIQVRAFVGFRWCRS